MLTHILSSILLFLSAFVILLIESGCNSDKKKEQSQNVCEKLTEQSNALNTQIMQLSPASVVCVNIIALSRFKNMHQLLGSYIF